jgi:hypothetical protein
VTDKPDEDVTQAAGEHSIFFEPKDSRGNGNEDDPRGELGAGAKINGFTARIADRADHEHGN